MDPTVEQEIRQGIVPEEWDPARDDAERVKLYLRAYQECHTRLEQVRLSADAERERIAREENAAAQEVEKPMAFLKAMLQLYSEHIGRKKHVTLDGTLRWAKGRESVEIEDRLSFCVMHRGTHFVRVKEEPDKVSIRRHIKNTGEIPEGAELRRGDDQFEVVVP